MTDSPPPSRPQQVTSAVVLAVCACTLAVVNVFSTRDALRGSALRDAIAEAQGSVGLERNGQFVVRLFEVLVPVSGALAAAAAVLAVYAWQRHRAAWIGFFVLAGLLALTLPVAGVVPVLLLAAAVTFLASRPARDWYADRPATAGAPLVLSQEGPRAEGPQQGPPQGPPQGPAQGPPQGPPPYAGQFGSGGGVDLGKPSGEEHGGSSAAPDQPWSAPPPYGSTSPYGSTPPYGSTSPYGGSGPGWSPSPYGSAYGQQQGPYAGAQPPGRGPDKRPGTVTAACVITWIGASLTALMLVLTAVFLVSNGGTFTQEFRRQVGGETGLTGDDLLTILWGVVGVGLLWCLGAIVVAVLAFRRNRGGRIALAVSAALTVLVSLLAILSILSAVPLLMGIAVLVLLFTGGANDWYARRGGWSPPSGGPSGGQPYGPPYGQQYSQPGQYRQQGQPGQPAQPPQEHTGPW